VIFTGDNQVIGTFSAYRADYSFGVWISEGRSQKYYEAAKGILAAKSA
jgi:hypothetical protein